MSVINPNEIPKSWRTNKREPAVQAYLSGAEGDVADLVGARVAGLPFNLSIVPVTDWIQPDELETGAVNVIQVDADTPASIKRFELLVRATTVPLIAAAHEPPLALVRMLMRAGARDVLPLPLDVAELEAALATLSDELVAQQAHATVRNDRVVTAIKSVGGIGATAVLGQLAIRFAANERRRGREACLIDLDLQFGNAAFQLGLRPHQSVADLLDAGARLDGELIRAAAVMHSSGLAVIAAPSEMLPLESVSSDHLIELVELCGREFGTVFLDLPASWTNWSLSLIARSELVLLLTELSVTGLQRTRRQLNLLASQDLDELEIRVIANRFEKSQLRTIKASDVRQALGRDLAYTIANEPAVMQAALEQGISISEVRRKSAVGRDLDLLDAGVAAVLGLER
jgi:pilus assembly protein CpaE